MLSRDQEIAYIQQLIDRPKHKAIATLQNLRDNMESVEFIGHDLVLPTMEFRPYQVVGAMHLVMMNRFILGDDTGLGKTIQEILAMSMVKAKIPDTKFIIICPKSAVLQWNSEITRFSSVLKFRPFLASMHKPNTRAAVLEEFTHDSEWDGIVTNYAMLSANMEEITKVFETKPGYLVLDEVTSVKNWSQKKKPIVCIAADMVTAKAKYVHGLSATLMKKSPLEVWAIYNVILPGLFPNLTKFKQLFCIETMVRVAANRKIKTIVGYKNIPYIKDLIEPYYLGRKKTDPVIAKFIPKIVSREIRVDLDPGVQQKKYNEALSGMLELGDGEFAETTNPLACMLYCSQIANSPEVIGIKGRSAKEEELYRLMEDEIGDDKVILFSKSKKFLNLIEERLSTKEIWGKIQPVLRITGDENDKQREQNKLLFQTDPDYRILLLTTAGSEAINLQNGNTIIFLDPPVTYGDFLQIAGRVNRSGSKHEYNFFYFLIANNTIDEHVMELISKEKKWFDVILGESAPGAIDFESTDITRELIQMMKEDALRLKK